MINRLNTTRTLILILLLALALAACGPAESEEEETASLTAVAAEGEQSPASEPTGSEESEPAEESSTEPVESAAPETGDSTITFDLYGGVDAADFESTASGLLYYFLNDGDGQVAEEGQMLMVNIIGWLADGTEITNSAAFGGPVPLPVGTPSGLVGLDEALTLLSAGSNTRVVLSGDLTAGSDGAPSPLPPGEVAFEIEVIEIVDGPPTAPQSVNEDDYSVTENGVLFYDLEEGAGPALEPGQSVSIDYTGWDQEGTILNSTVGTQPLIFIFGSDEVFPGWDEGLEGVKSGGSRQIVVPGELAAPLFGPDADPETSALTFEITVLEINDGPPEAPQSVDEGEFVTTDSGLKYYDFEEGSGPEVTAGQQVSVHYTGWLEDGSTFDSSIGKQPFTLIVGAGSVIQGWDEGLQGMKVGGRRQLVIPAELGYGESGSGRIPPGATLIFEVEIVDVQ